jgi:hypothetical protein
VATNPFLVPAPLVLLHAHRFAAHACLNLLVALGAGAGDLSSPQDLLAATLSPLTAAGAREVLALAAAVRDGGSGGGPPSPCWPSSVLSSGSSSSSLGGGRRAPHGAGGGAPSVEPVDG